MSTAAASGHDLQHRAEGALATLFSALPEVTGSLLASVDGRPLASDLPADTQRAVAAIVASSFALGGKLAELGGAKNADELVVRSANGHVAVYAVGRAGALVVLTKTNVNLGLLHLKSRDAIAELEPLVQALWTDSR